MKLKDSKNHNSILQRYKYLLSQKSHVEAMIKIEKKKDVNHVSINK